jgi:OOP family OmpA-OmpF porin
MRACVRRPVALAALGIAALVGGDASADCTSTRVATCVDSDSLWPHAGPGPFFSLGSTTTTPMGQLSASLVTSYLSRPIGLRVPSADPAGTTVFAVDNVVDATLLLAWGVTDRFEVVLAAPTTFVQNGAGAAAVTNSTDQLPRSALRDLRFGFTYALVPPDRKGEPRGFGLVGRVEFAAPTSTVGAFAGSRTATLAPTLVGSYQSGKWLGSLEVGARIRWKETLGDAVVGSQIFAGLGGSYALLPKGWLSIGAEAFALPTIASQNAPSVDKTQTSAPPPIPAEWIASVTSAPFLAGDFSVSLGGGGRIPFSSQAPLFDPRFRFDLAIRYAPTGRDTDKDGIPDARDKCPNEPEDVDGFEDADGCPDPDNDKDGIPDAVDKCPNHPEDFDGFQDADGCPDRDDPHRAKVKAPAGEPAAR